MTHALARFREKTKLSRRQLAEKAETTRQTVHRIEKRKQTPSLDLIARFVKVSDGLLRADDFLPETKEDVQ